MGKGDIKTRLGKITNGSYGNKRPRKSSAKADAPAAETKPEKK